MINVQKLLLICGILASLLYVATDISAGMRYEGYSFTSQAISELAAIGAPTKPIMDIFLGVYNVLMVLFAVGVLLSAGQNRALRITGWLLLAITINGFAWYFSPMHMRGTEITLTDRLHVFHAGIASLLLFLAIGFGAAALGKSFRFYSIATIVILLVSGVLIWLDAPRMEANLPTPWAGIKERVEVYDYLLWIGVLSAALLRKPSMIRRSY